MSDDRQNVDEEVAETQGHEPASQPVPIENTSEESDLWIGRTHWKHFAGRIAALGGFLVFLLAGIIWATPRMDWLTGWTAFWIVLVVGGLSSGVILGGVAYKVFSQRFRVTTQRLFIERGILSQTIDQTELIRVDDVRIHKSILDRTFGLGSIEVVSTDSTEQQVRIEGICDPDRVAESIRTQMRAMRKKSLFIESI